MSGALIWQRVKLGAAILAVILSVAATFYCVWIFSYAWVDPLGRINWIPLAYFVCMNALCLYGAWVLNAEMPNRLVRHSIWVSQGLFAGFVVAGMWSIGVFFAPSWLLLTLLALVDLIVTRTNILIDVILITLMLALATAQTGLLVIAPRLFDPYLQGSGGAQAMPAPTATPRP